MRGFDDVRLGRCVAVWLALLPVACAVWGPHLSGVFFWDDAAYLRDNPLFGPSSSFFDAVTIPVTGQAFRPLSTATLWLEARSHGFSMPWFRSVQVLLHLSTAALSFVWLSRLLSDRIAALFGAALFFVHPAVTEPVMFVSARHDLLGGAFAVAALAAAAKMQGAPRLVTVFACVLASALCKESYVIVAPLAALSALATADETRGAVQASWRIFAVSVIATGIAIALRLSVGVSLASGASAPSSVLVRILATLLVHHGAAFSTFRDAPTAERFVPLAAGTAALVLCATAVCLVALVRHSRRSRRARTAALGLATFVLSLAPSSAAIPATGQYGNRYGYLALAGFAALSAAAFSLVWHAAPRARRGLVAGSVAGLAVVALLASRRAADWHDGLRLFAADVARVPDDSRAAYHYGVELVPVGGCEAALPYFERARTAEPSYARAQRNTAGCLLRLHRPADALEPARAAVRLDPEQPANRRNLAAALAGIGEREEAARVLRGESVDGAGSGR